MLKKTNICDCRPILVLNETILVCCHSHNGKLTCTYCPHNLGSSGYFYICIVYIV